MPLEEWSRGNEVVFHRLGPSQRGTERATKNPRRKHPPIQVEVRRGGLDSPSDGERDPLFHLI